MTAFLILLETLIKKDAQKMIEVMHIDKVRNWFGDRGYPFYDNSKLRYKVINIKGSRWIFIHDSQNYDDEVELYYMNTIYCEPFDDVATQRF
jgi:glutamine amidotransferase PdxT